jgi:hypothetical protein
MQLQSAQEGTGTMKVLLRLMLAAISACLLLGAAQAGAKTISPYVYSGSSFDGTGSTAGAFQEIDKLKVHQATGTVYAIDTGTGMLSRFSASGSAVPFTAPALGGASSIDFDVDTGSWLALDNSGTTTDGRVYILEGHFEFLSNSGVPVIRPVSTTVHVLDPSGAALGGSWPLCGAFECGKPENWRAFAANVGVGPDGQVWIGDPPSTDAIEPGLVRPFDAAGTSTPTDEDDLYVGDPVGGLDLDQAGDLYLIENRADYRPVFQANLVGTVSKYEPNGTRVNGAFSRPVSRGDDLAVERSDGLVFVDDSDRIRVYDAAGGEIDTFGQVAGPYGGLSGSNGVAINEATDEVYVGNAASQEVDIFEPGPPVLVPDVMTDAVTDIDSSSATLNGTLDPAGGGNTTVCRFEWGVTAALASTAPCAQQVYPSNGGPVQVSADIGGLTKGTQYHVRLVTDNAAGPLQSGRDMTFRAANPPDVQAIDLENVDQHSATVHLEIDPEGGDTTYRVELGPTVSYGTTRPAPLSRPERECFIGFGNPRVCSGRLLWGGEKRVPAGVQAPAVALSGLDADATYHYRVVVENGAGVVTSSDRTFHTFPFLPEVKDECANKLARQQTGAGQLLDCRAYELVSAADTNGYDVESDLAPGQQPFPGFPLAHDKVLYAVHDGGISGTGNPTNRGPDPYVATRGEDGWKTKYIGIPSDTTPSALPFSSTLLDADSTLSSFAFGGPEICDPCFADGSVDIPMRLSDGSLVKGMQGSLDPGSADAGGDVRKNFSDDGSHFVFGTDAQFEPDGNENGDVSIYDRNLGTDETQVVSKLPDGSTMTGTGIAQLDISDDGERIVVAQKVSADAAGNEYWHPYMHIGTSDQTVDLAPGTTSGVLYNGMTGDGTAVLFVTPDPLTNDDTDTSADLYRVSVSLAGADLTRISSGSAGTGDTDSCDPVTNSVNPNWNSVDEASDCSVAAVSGGGGIAVGDGSVFFLSPELLDGPGNGTSDAPNLYLARPGEDPKFVATMESKLTGPVPLNTSHPFDRAFGNGTLAAPESLAVDDTTGAVYVLDFGANTVRKFDANGNSATFSHTGQGTLGSFAFALPGTSQVAVDNSGGVNDGNIYVADFLNFRVRVFKASGEELAPLTGSTAPPINAFPVAAGVTVDDDGRVYVLGTTFEDFTRIHRYDPKGTTIDDSDWDGLINPGFPPFYTQLAADSTGSVYVHEGAFFGGTPGATKFVSSQFGSSEAEQQGSIFNTQSVAAAVDLGTDDVYISRGATLRHYTSGGTLLETFGSPQLASATAIAVNSKSGRVYASDATANDVKIFKFALTPERGIDSPLVIHAVNDSGQRYPTDLQVNRAGSAAAFPTTVSFDGYENRGHTQVLRYDAIGDSLACISCSPSLAPSPGDSSLASAGLSVTEDGRVFFNSFDRMVQRDSNSRQDVYEWTPENGGATELISTGTHSSASSLLSVSADGTDAFFFTRQKLVSQDHNGPVVKLYTARSGGGLFVLPKTKPCQASDECHGPGTIEPPAPPIGSYAATPGQFPSRSRGPRRCKKGQVRKRKTCVKRTKAKSKIKTNRPGGRG